MIARQALPLVAWVRADQAQQNCASPQPRQLRDVSHERPLSPVLCMPGEVQEAVPLQDAAEEVAMHAGGEGMVHLHRRSCHSSVLQLHVGGILLQLSLALPKVLVALAPVCAVGVRVPVCQLLQAVKR